MFFTQPSHLHMQNKTKAQRVAVAKAKICFCTDTGPLCGKDQQMQHLMLEKVKRLCFITTN